MTVDIRSFWNLIKIFSMRKSLIANQPEVVVKTKSLLITTIYLLVIIAVSVFIIIFGLNFV